MVINDEVKDMYRENVCKFVNARPSADVIRTINFIYETKNHGNGSLKFDAFYKMHFVVSGKGCLCTANSQYPLSPGDVFFTFPSVRYAIESDTDFTYMYISFLGFRGNMLMEQLKICSSNPVMYGYQEALSIWEHFFSISTSRNLDMIAEGTLLYTFSLISSRTESERQRKEAHKGVLQTKRYIDEHFQDQNLSIEAISKVLPYNKKYISTAFKKHMSLTISQYISIVRLQHARALIEQGGKSIKDIAYLCGFSDPLYFSRVFKKSTGMSPTEYIEQSPGN